MPLEPDETLEAITLGETLGHAFAMLPHAAHQVGGHADIERAAWLVGQDIHPAARHAASLVRVDPRVKPAGDGLWVPSGQARGRSEERRVGKECVSTC